MIEDLKKRKSLRRVRLEDDTSHLQSRCSCSLMKKIRLYKWRYTSFINSPRVCFIYDTFFYTIFLLLFSYMILCRFVYYVDELDRDNDTNDGNKTEEDESTKLHLLSSNQSSEHLSGNLSNIQPVEQAVRQVTMPSRLEYTLMVWVIIYLIEEVKQVSERLLKTE